MKRNLWYIISFSPPKQKVYSIFLFKKDNYMFSKENYNFICYMIHSGKIIFIFYDIKYCLPLISILTGIFFHLNFLDTFLL